MDQNSSLDKFNNQELISGIAALIIFGFIKIMSMRLPAKVSGYPIAMSNVAFVLAIIFFIRCVVRFVRGTGNKKKMFSGDTAGYAKYWLTLVLLVIYAIAFKRLGFGVSSFIFILAFSTAFAQKRNMVLNLLVSVGFTAVIYVAFKIILGIPLPSGILF